MHSRVIFLNTKRYSSDSNPWTEISILESNPILELLGVSIDGQINFKEHVGDITKKASKQVGVVLRLRNIIPQSAKLKIYKTAKLPLLTYCHIVWHFCAASDAL